MFNKIAIRIFAEGVAVFVVFGTVGMTWLVSMSMYDKLTRSTHDFEIPQLKLKFEECIDLSGANFEKLIVPPELSYDKVFNK